jgi:uncharacterized protein
VDRCFFCKSNLYAAISGVADGPIASGTNLDDLMDFRPGLRAAEARGVIHPYVEAGIGKADVYRLAASLGLDDLAALPAQPCLASRIETGIAVEPADLAFIEAIESALSERLPGASAIRCRVTRAGVHVECAPLPDSAVLRADLAAVVAARCAADGRVFAGLRAYRRGAAFVVPQPA